MTPTRPDLDAIRKRETWPNGATVLLHVEERDALVAWVEALENILSNHRGCLVVGSSCAHREPA